LELDETKSLEKMGNVPELPAFKEKSKEVTLRKNTPE
jgi:hypothetical protein